MRTLKVCDVPATPPLPGPIYHRSAELLVPAGGTLSSEVRDRLERSGIAEVCVLDPGEDEEKFRFLARTRKVLLSDVADGTPLRAELRDAAGKLLIRPGTALDSSVRQLLLDNGVKGFYVRRSAAELGLDEVEMFRALSAEAAPNPIPPDETPLPPGDRRLGKEWSEGMLKSWIEPPSSRAARPFAEGVSSRWRMTLRTPEHRIRYLHAYESLLRDVKELYARLKNDPSVPVSFPEGIARRILGALAEDRDLLLNLVNWKARGPYLPSHALHVAILSAAMGITAQRSHDEIFELALAGLLARAGMLSVPQAIQDKPGPLSPAEMSQVKHAPVLGIALLRKIDWLPVRVVIAAYHCMERADGSGYPQGLTAARIHRHATLVAVADVYDALLATRPYRAALLPYHAMESVLHMVRGGKLDSQAVRTLLDTVSLFPLGSWVQLSDGRIARVVAAERGQHTRPVVTAMYAQDRGSVPPERVDLAVQTSLTVARAVARDDLDAGTLTGW